MKFLIKPQNDQVKMLYTDHGTYHQGDSGLDLFVVADEIIPAGQTKLIDLGISCQLVLKNPVSGLQDNKYYSYTMYARSSIAKTPLRLANGVGLIDSNYTGTIKAALHNTGTENFAIKKGERYVQLARPDLEEVSFQLVTEFNRITSRSDKSFGSTTLV